MADAGDAGSAGGVVQIDPGSGLQTPLSAGGRPTDIAYGLFGDLVVNELATSSVVRIDAVSGARTPLASGDPLVSPYGVAVGPVIVPALSTAPRSLLGAILLAVAFARMRRSVRNRTQPAAH